eukprot:SAG31_NODE_4435_length_3232_cov_1.786467_1_plen_165_part_00
MVDPCGQAGGKYKQTPVGGDSVFQTVTANGTTYAMGDLGSKVLPVSAPEDVTTWKIGSTPRVAWGMRYNHGGGASIVAPSSAVLTRLETGLVTIFLTAHAGYQYRLCPLEKMPCTEQDFQKMPLDFVRGSQAIMWNNGSLYNISEAAKYVDDSVCDVVPKGSTW